MEDESSMVVIDAGSGTFRAGYAGDEAPITSFPSVIGSTRFSQSQQKQLMTDACVGSEAQEMRDLLSLRYPIERGIVTNWSDMETLLGYSYNQLKVSSNQYPLLFSQPPLTPRAQKENLAQLMFEVLDCPALDLTDSSYLCLYTSGRNCAVTMNIGEGVAFAVPFYESHCIKDGIQRQELAGTDVTHHLRKLLHDRGHSFTTSSEIDSIREMKEKLCYIALDSDTEANEVEAKSHSFSDGTSLSIQEERYLCTEILFQPSLFGVRGVVGVQDMVFNAIERCELNSRGDILCNVMVSGGTVHSPGFVKRLKKELVNRYPKSMKINVIEDQFGVWIGGSILSSLSTFQYCLVSKQMYEEFGPSIFH